MKERALYIASNLFPVNSGATIYTYGNIKRLSDYYDIDLVSFIQCEKPETDLYYEQLIIKVNSFQHVNFKKKYLHHVICGLKHGIFFQKFSKEFEKIILSYLEKNQYSRIFLDGILTYYLLDLIKLISPDSKIILIEHNIEFQNLEEEYYFSKKFFKKIYLCFLKYGVKDFELNTVKKANYSLFISDEDAKIMGQLTNEPKSDKYLLLPPFFPFEQIIYPDDLNNNKYNLLILGSMWWYPNIEGTKWFITKVFPVLIGMDNRYKLFVVGNSPSKEIQKLEDKNVIFTGSVLSVDEYLKNSDFLIVPTFTGGGVKIKIFEGILKGIPVIARTENIIGYKDVFADSFNTSDPYKFAQMIVSYNQKPNLKNQFIKQGREKLMKFADISELIQKLN